MMGQHSRSESLFYYLRIEDQVPGNHLLRFIDRYVSFDFVREKLRASYSETGRASIDPEVLLRILLLGYLYGITSERKLLEELRMHLAWRWFTSAWARSDLPTCRRATAIAAEHVPKKRNAPVGDTNIWPFTFMSRHDNAHGVGEHTGVFQGTTTAQKSRGFVSRNSRIRSGCAACAYGA